MRMKAIIRYDLILISNDSFKLFMILNNNIELFNQIELNSIFLRKFKSKFINSMTLFEIIITYDSDVKNTLFLMFKSSK